MKKPYEGGIDERCPLMHGSLCSKVCPTCKFQIKVKGQNPNSGEDIDKWDCAFTFQALLAIESNFRLHQLGAATESFRNEVVNQNNSLIGGTVAVARAVISKSLDTPVPPLQIADGS